MPELPEVEIAARKLRRWSEGGRLEGVKVRDKRILAEGTPAALEAALEGRAIAEVERHGKHLLLVLDDATAVWIHLGMAGKLVLREAGDEPNLTRVRADLNGRVLCFVDPRLIGRIAAGERAAILALSRIDRLGPDALTLGSGAALKERLGRSARPIKILLVEQQRLAGLGNIQAVEALFLAGIHPEKSAAALDDAALDRLAEGIQATLARTLELDGGEEELTYLSEGREDNPFFVYKQGDNPCGRCQATITSIEMGGRTTYFCPGCQSL